MEPPRNLVEQYGRWIGGPNEWNTTVYSLNMLGDAVRDLLDPRLRGGGGRLGADAANSV